MAICKTGNKLLEAESGISDEFASHAADCPQCRAQINSEGASKIVVLRPAMLRVSNSSSLGSHLPIVTDYDR